MTQICGHNDADTTDVMHGNTCFDKFHFWSAELAQGAEPYARASGFENSQMQSSLHWKRKQIKSRHDANMGMDL